MKTRALALFALLLLPLSAAAETVYKYRNADGTMTYSNRMLPNAELIETFNVNYPPAAARPETKRAPSTAETAADGRVKLHLAALDKAWFEVQDATRALTAAESRLAAGVAPQDGETAALGGPLALSPSDVGGAQAPVAPAVGGPAQPVAPPGQTPAQAAAARAAAQAVGGPMGTSRGGRRNPEYFDRMAALEADVVRARTRLDMALKAYNQLR